MTGSMEFMAETGDVIVCEFEDTQTGVEDCETWLTDNLPEGCVVESEDCDMHLHDFWDSFCAGGINPVAWCVIPFEGWAEYDLRCEYTLNCDAPEVTAPTSTDPDPGYETPDPAEYPGSGTECETYSDCTCPADREPACLGGLCDCTSDGGFY